MSKNTKKPNTSRTLGQLHFEDLNPSRFEDLVRELIYDYKDWRSIEATGRSGSDDGFDARAYEKTSVMPEVNEEGELEESHPMEGNLWMIQCKREKAIGPSRIKEILAEIDEKNPPYGYILAAAADFSKKSYDVFRDELRKKGVMEFYLWGKATLEDMLHQPKNDRILFTFFGISLVAKRKTRTSAVKSIISTKNKLYKILGEQRTLYSQVLIRDLKDEYYPHDDCYKDFEKKPRWKEYAVIDRDPRGLGCRTHRYYAYIDRQKKEYDFTTEIDLMHRKIDEHNHEARRKKMEMVEEVWNFFPKKNQGYLCIDRLVQYSDIAAIDEKGDNFHDFLHLYVDFTGENGPFSGSRNTGIIGLGGREEEFSITDKYKRIKIFPKKFGKPNFKLTHADKTIKLDPASSKNFFLLHSLYAADEKYSPLKIGDVIQVENVDQYDKTFIQITHKFKTTIKNHLNQFTHNYRYKTTQDIENQLERKINEEEEITVCEFRRVYERDFVK